MTQERLPDAGERHAGDLKGCRGILGWLPKYQSDWLRLDLVVGKSIGGEECPWNLIRKN
jgi:hypothetical protein